jgi:hypothetical protein
MLSHTTLILAATSLAAAIALPEQTRFTPTDITHSSLGSPPPSKLVCKEGEGTICWDFAWDVQGKYDCCSPLECRKPLPFAIGVRPTMPAFVWHFRLMGTFLRDSVANMLD